MYMLKNQPLSSNGKPRIKVERKELEVLSRPTNKDLICLEPSSLHLCVSPPFPTLRPSFNQPIWTDYLSPTCLVLGAQGKVCPLLSYTRPAITSQDLGLELEEE